MVNPEDYVVIYYPKVNHNPKILFLRLKTDKRMTQVFDFLQGWKIKWALCITWSHDTKSTELDGKWHIGTLCHLPSSIADFALCDQVTQRTHYDSTRYICE